MCFKPGVYYRDADYQSRDDERQSRIGNSITDGAYTAMMNAIRHDETPNFYFMQYELATWRVKNLLLVPSFAFRPPPSLNANRFPPPPAVPAGLDATLL
jgi:hypothetical protein